MIKKIIKILLFLLLTIFLCVTVFLVYKHNKNLKCKNIYFSFDTHSFVDKNTILDILDRKNIKLDSTVYIQKLNIDTMEFYISKNIFIKKVEIFSDFWGNITFSISQRKPIARIITQNNKHFYIDDQYEIIPLSKKYTALVPVVSGEISNDFFNKKDTINLNFYNNFYDFLTFINNSEFWKNQISQIYLNSDTNIFLIPRVGNQKIILGKLENYKYKMNKLFSLYKELFQNNNLDKYKEINLIFSDQVVCKKR